MQKLIRHLIDNLLVHFGASNTWQAGVIVPEVTEKLITDVWNWYLGLKEQDSSLVKGTYVLMEMMQKVCVKPPESDIVTVFLS